LGYKLSFSNFQIPCDVQFSIKSSSTKQKGIQEAFIVEPTHKVAIPPHSHIYATVTFKPGAIQTYYTLFEAVPDGTKGKGLSFDIQGEGNLPQVSLLKPTLRNPKGYTMLLFKRILRNRSQVLPLTLKNTGTIPATVLIETISGAQAFTVVPADEDAPGNYAQTDDDHPKPKALPPPEAFHLAVNETRDCMIMFRPSAVKKFRGELCVRIQDNQFEKLPIQLIGEGYEDEVCVENIRGQFDVEATNVEEVPEDIDGKLILQWEWWSGA
jgi:hydrocephalus-inducing protein